MTTLNILILFFRFISLSKISVIQETTRTKDVTQPRTSKTRTPITHAEKMKIKPIVYKKKKSHRTS